MNFETTMESLRLSVDQALESYLPAPEAYPPLVHQAMRYSVVGGGKRLRPVLVLAAAEVVGGEPRNMLPAACALEMIHAYSLIHDDLPAMDNDDYRRGKPTNHKVYGEAIAILAGDALLTLAFSLLTKTSAVEPERVVRVMAEIAAAAGTTGMVGGQVVDILSAGKRVDAPTLEYIHRHKTGALYRAAVRTGAVLAGAPVDKLKSLTDYAEYLGLAFQITDDLLDVEGDMAKLGKPIGSDVKNKKGTYPLLYGLDRTRKEAARAAENAVAALSIFGKEADFLRTLVQYIIERDN